MNQQRTSAIAYYDTVETAEQVVKSLLERGHPGEDISLITLPPNSDKVTIRQPGENVTSSEGAGFGAVVGGIAGALVGLATLTIPGIGPVLVAGPLAVALSGVTGALLGAGAGALTGGLTAALVDFGFTEEEAGALAEQLQSGRAIVAVAGRDGNLAGAIQILEQSRPARLRSTDGAVGE
ncbi:MAG: general stress protein [Anaerolineae bacterium]|nr:general stress protein [Anaerolineae bacterium]